jgi:HK97 family phage prohead protease
MTEEQSITFDDATAEEIAATFQADVEKRTITGLMVPWNKVARSGFAKWKFSPGSLRWSAVRRVKANLSHDRHEAVGVATRLDPGNAGLHGTFKIARGSEGDRALSLAEDGVLDGFSIEVDFEEGDGWEPDPSDESVRLVRKARLVGVALTGFPAFDDARVDRVAAARQAATPPREGVRMEQEEKVTSDEEGGAQFESYVRTLADKLAESQQAATEKLGQSIGESITAGFKSALENIGDPQGGPEKVRSARFTTLTEPPVYRFDGSGHHSLVKDAWKAINDKGTPAGDEAQERIRKFRLQSEDMAEVVSGYLRFAPQTTTSASQIIPPGYRPDLYVNELNRGRPMIDGASRGTLSDATPFTVPTFTSSTTASADHVEGTNPSDGSIALGLRTVTPQGISGRMVVTRELVDSSNPAIDQIAFNTMRESYARQTETKLYTLLNGTSGAGGTITTDNVPSGAMASTTAKGTDNQTLVKHIRERLAKYPFQRFLFPTTATMGQAATVLLATAVDTTQRPLFPWSENTNAPGLGNTATGGYQVDSLRFQPAWANTGVAAGDSQILIWNDADVWVWESPLLTFRFEEKQGPANIELNIFGYFATHLLRPVGLSGIRIT